MTDEEIIEAFRKKRRAEFCKAVVRPKFRLFKECLQILAATAVIALSVHLYGHISLLQFWMLISVEIIIFIITQTKNIIFLLIFCYQKFAPKTIRGACLFTPCCSEYMRISIGKYGVIKGISKGFKRLRRCRPPNGGLDEP